MSRRDEYQPGPADAARVEKNGDQWTLIVVKMLRHGPEQVWEALTDPDQLREWAPFDPDRNLDGVGAIRLTTAGMGDAPVPECEVTRADRPHRLEYNWGGQSLRWELEAEGTGTKLTLWHNIDRNFIAMGAAGWHLCLDVMAAYLDGDPMGRIVAGDALKFEGWQRLHREYQAKFGVKSADEEAE